MSKRSWARRLALPAALALLAGLSGCLMSERCRQSPTLCARPDEPAEEVTPLAELCGYGMRPASILKKTGLKSSEVPILNRFRDKVGIPLANVEAFAVVCFDFEEHRVLLVRTKRDLVKSQVMKACQASKMLERADDTKVYTGPSGLAVHFPKPNLAVIADSPATMAHCLKQKLEVLGHLDEAGKHDVSTWGKSITASHDPRLRAPREFTSALFSRPINHVAARAAPPPAGEDIGLQYLPLPVPHSAKRARLTMDLGPAAQVKIEVNFADEESAKIGKDVLAEGIEILRGQLIFTRGLVALLKRSPCMFGLPREQSEEIKLGGQYRLVAAASVDFMKRAEKAMESASVEARGKLVTGSFRVPLKVEDRAACAKLLRLVQEEYSGCTSFGPGLLFESRTARGHQLPPVPCPPGLEEPGGPVRPPGPVVPIPPDVSVPLPPIPPPAPDSGKMTLTVANVLQEDVLLFTSPAIGELTFVQKLRAGEAVDLPTRLSQRWVAVYLSEPYRDTHLIHQDGQTWLIRPKPAVMPCATMPYRPAPVPTQSQMPR